VSYKLKIKRVYEKPKPGDGTRILVDRLWPRGLSKAKAKLDLWLKEIAPSTELRKWFDTMQELAQLSRAVRERTQESRRTDLAYQKQGGCGNSDASLRSA
jgi:uncharacterized protein YeaO (DUF488 family)